MNLGHIYTKKILVACLKFQLTGQFVFYHVSKQFIHQVHEDDAGGMGGGFAVTEGGCLSPQGDVLSLLE